jgi:hypothetical protein
MRIICFADLDDTFLQTEAKCPVGMPLAPAALDRGGRVRSFMTAQQQRLFEALAAIADIVPVTGRSLEALDRVQLPFTSFQATFHGAVVTTGPERRPHPPWADAVYPALRARRAQLEATLGPFADWAAAAEATVETRIIEVSDVPTYVSVKGRSAEEMARLAELIDLPVLGKGLRIHLNGRNLALLPAETSKRRAVAHITAFIREQAGADLLTLGFGDSLSDLPFLAECDFATTPRGSQIVRAFQGHFAGEDL